MSRNGAGTYTLPAGNPVTTGTTISSTWANNTLSDIATALSQSIASDGQTPVTANIPMSNFKFTGIGSGSNLTDSVNYSQVQNSAYSYLTSVSGTNTITAVVTPSATAYAAGQSFRFVAAATNTGSVTININSIGAKNITKNGVSALVGGEIQIGSVVTVTYDGTQFQLESVNSTTPIFESINNGQLAGFRNKIINGDMNVSQRGTTFAAIANGSYSLDRWKWTLVNSTSVQTITKSSDVPSSNEFQNSLRVEITTADASIAAGDVAYLQQPIEGYNARDLIGQTFTLSFWVRSSKTGTHCISFSNNGSDRSYVSAYTINVANTWEYKSVTVTGGLITSGTWDWTSGVGVSANFTLACGSTYQTTAGAWQTGVYLGTSAQVNCLDTIGNIFAITGVQLERGPVATSFEHLPYGSNLALCQRYYNAIQAEYNGNVTSGNSYGSRVTVNSQFRSVPTCVVAAQIFASVNFPGISTGDYDAVNSSAASVRFVKAASATATGYWGGTYGMSAEL